MDIYAVFLDIDETLTCEGRLPEENIRVINEAHERGHKIFLNTGRSYGHIPEIVLNSLKLDGFVAGIGSHVVYNDVLLKRERFSVHELYELAKHYFESGRECIFEGEVNAICKNTPFGGKNRLDAESAEDFPGKYRDIPITKVFLGGVLPQSEQKLLSENYTFFQHEGYAEFAHNGCSKSEGMRLVLEYLNIPKERCIAMGDSVNDIDMLRYAGISIAMGNAGDEIKSICTQVTDTAKNAGVAKALLKFLP